MEILLFSIRSICGHFCTIFIISQGDWYHRNCFRCVDCNRLLDSLTNCDGPDGQLYCKKCYCVKYGPQTRSSDVDHKLIDLSTIKVEEGQPGKNCPRYIRANFDANILEENDSYKNPV